jgi:hypothetical protein
LVAWVEYQGNGQGRIFSKGKHGSIGSIMSSSAHQGKKT